MPEPGISTIVSSDDECAPKSQVSSSKKPRMAQNCERSELLRKAAKHMENLAQKENMDEADIYANAWACSYRKLSEEQKLFAKKACDEIFVLGQLEKLTLNSVQQQTFPSRQRIYGPQIISINENSNSSNISQSTPVHYSNLPQVFHIEDPNATSSKQYSLFHDLLADTDFN